MWDGEDLGGDDEGETMIRIYCLRTLFSIKYFYKEYGYIHAI